MAMRRWFVDWLHWIMRLRGARLDKPGCSGSAGIRTPTPKLMSLAGGSQERLADRVALVEMWVIGCCAEDNELPTSADRRGSCFRRRSQEAAVPARAKAAGSPKRKVRCP
ncbi:hypothetical protein GCM10009687_15350 [Asanoa iriomotensis]